MTSNIQILPSGNNFISEGNSNLLEAGLRAGLALGYGCSNGNCGQCLAKIISGEVRKIRHHDFIITDREKAGGHVLMCCNAAITDVVLQALEAQDSSEIPQQKVTARVKSVEIINDNVALMHLKTPRTNRLRFLAGQYVQLGGAGLPKALHSISSCPCDDMNLHFQIPRLGGDEFTDFVFSSMRKGDLVNITGPSGSFVLNEASKRPLVFIAWHTGFAPIRSLIEHAMALDVSADMYLLWVTTGKGDRYQDNLCRSWHDALDNFIYVPVDADMVNRAVDAGSIFKHTNIEPAKLVEYDFYIAGNDVLLKSCKKFLTDNNLPTEQLSTDNIKHA